MTSDRASIFADDEPVASSRPSAEQVRALAETGGFTSREPRSPAAQPPRQPRTPWRYRTGRDVQFNVKVSQATRDGFEVIAERLNRPKGEIVERALAALERELAAADRAGQG